METKPLIRKRMQRLRDAIPPEERERKSRVILDQLTSLPVYRNADQILVYVNYRSEVITRYLIEKAWKEERRVFVPLCRKNNMVWCPLSSFEELSPGMMGIPEPVGLEPEEIRDGLVILPGLAFDRERHRIGYGGGYYDRFLAEHPRCRTAAVAYELQVLPDVPWTDRDAVPEALITETGIYSDEMDTE